MVGRKRGSARLTSNTSHSPASMLGAPNSQNHARYVLAGCSAAVSLLLGVWALTALHRLHSKVGQAVLSHDNFAAGRITIHSLGVVGSNGWPASKDSSTVAAGLTHAAPPLEVAAAVAAAAGALAAGSRPDNDGRPDGQQQQLQVQVTVTHVDSGRQPPQQHGTSQRSHGTAATQSAVRGEPASNLQHHQAHTDLSATTNNKAALDQAKHQQGSMQSTDSSQARPETDADPAAAANTPGPPPKVALLFLVQDSLANEAVWKVFLLAAAQLQLQPGVAAAAAAAAHHTSKVTLKDAIGPATSLHPDVGTFAAWAYPGYRVQHGLTPGAAAAPPARHMMPMMPAAAAKQQQLQAAAGAGAGTGASSAAISKSPQRFPAAADAWEEDLLQAAVQDLTAPEHHPAGAAGVGNSRRPSTAASQQQLGAQQQPWSPYTQLSTLREALSAAAAAAAAAVTATSPGSAGSSSSADNFMGEVTRPQPVVVDPQRCLAAHRHMAADTRTKSKESEPSRQQQHPLLFSVYVHTPAGVLLPRDSVLSGCELAVRLNTTRGYAQHVLAEAEALLLHAALSDPLNAKFVLVSDTSIPLYPPQVIWSQLMFEPLSRVDACITPGRDTQLSSRWRSVMATSKFGPQHWRKSSQWFTLSRAHAELGVADLHVREMLHRYCYTNLTRVYPICASDEHWLPSLLASYGLDPQTDCEGLTHYADWSAGGWHPKTFTAADLTPQLVTLMRTGVSSKTAKLAALQKQWQHLRTLSSLAVAAGQQQQQLSAGPDARMSSSGRIEPSTTVFGASVSGGTPQNTAGAATQTGQTSKEQQRRMQAVGGVAAATASLQSQAHAAAVTMAAAENECHSALAVLTSTRHIFTSTTTASDTGLSGMQVTAAQTQQQQHKHNQQQEGMAGLEAAQLWGEAADGARVLSQAQGGNTSAQAPTHWLTSAGYKHLGQRCPLFARKFPAAIRQKVLYMALSCKGLGLGSWCVT